MDCSVIISSFTPKSCEIRNCFPPRESSLAPSCYPMGAVWRSEFACERAFVRSRRQPRARPNQSPVRPTLLRRPLTPFARRRRPPKQLFERSRIEGSTNSLSTHVGCSIKSLKYHHFSSWLSAVQEFPTRTKVYHNSMPGISGGRPILSDSPHRSALPFPPVQESVDLLAGW